MWDYYPGFILNYPSLILNYCIEDMDDYSNRIVRSRPLHAMFTAVPDRYDLVNRLMTWGFDGHWRREIARECLASRPKKMLDLCCGTGDLAINIARLARGNVELIGIDYSQPMLEIARRKAEKLDGAVRTSFIYGDAANLPFPDGYFDCVGISFAFRNLTYKNPHMKRHIAEVLRVLRAGGKFAIVETSQPGGKLIRWMYHLYLRGFVYRLGYLLSGNKGAYHYLSESASRFYTPEEIKEMLVAAGFRRVFFRPLLLSAAGIHVAIK